MKKFFHKVLDYFFPIGPVYIAFDFETFWFVVVQLFVLGMLVGICISYLMV